MPIDMVVHPVLKHVIVDGSNIATEGREIPSLAQLDEAVQAFIREYEPEIVTVVVDATFPNRIAKNERRTFEDAINAGEVITPPAGAIGRGDAFVLQIADRADASVLSNDSFQEFHGTYDWLFDEGRLIGGKPVPHVGWVFMPRTPVRGPASRRSISAARRAEAAESTATRAVAPAEA
ncbi:MAG: NYN domain-containing protein, partial [Acidimicrobiales bacterium]